MDKIQILEHYWGYNTFREGQEPLVESILAGRDVLGIMPTGAGKSLCYQLPALMLDGITLVVSPLISLMRDQVSALIQSGISAAFINSTLTPNQTRLALSRASEGRYKIIYAAPERLFAPAFANFAENANIAMVVIDEAHCVSQWGQNFRPSYLRISEFIQSLPKRPIAAAFTATATSRVKSDIINLLGLNSPDVTVTGFDRPNLYFEVSRPNDKFAELVSYLSMNRNKSGIVYCATRKLVDKVSDRLRDEGFNAGRYHAGMSDAERNASQEAFIRDECPIMVATNAFGMGIDKSNVSFVIHYNMPMNLESYYQEAGRAGRDGENAECILFYSGSDVRLNQFLIERSFENEDGTAGEASEALKNNELELLKQMTFYCTGRTCLRNFMLRYFGEKTSADGCGNCSNCVKPHSSFRSRDITVEAQKILSCVRRMGESQSRWVITDILRGINNNRVALCGGAKQSTFGIMKNYSVGEMDRLISSMISDKYLTDDGDEILAWGKKARSVIYSGERVTMRESDKPSDFRDESEIGANANPELLNRLKSLRRKIAEMNGVPAFVIFSDATLRDMSAKMPTTERQFQDIYGVGQVKARKFGRKFLKEIKDFLNGSEAAESEKADRQTNALADKASEKPKNAPKIHIVRGENNEYVLPEEVSKALFDRLVALRADLSLDFGMQSNSLVKIDALAQISQEKPTTLALLHESGLLSPRAEELCGKYLVLEIREFLESGGQPPATECDFEINPDAGLLEKLLELRRDISERIYTPENRIFSTASLKGMSALKPLTRTQLSDRLHIGSSKSLMFGRLFLSEIRGFAGEGDLPDGFEGAPEADRELFLKLVDLRHSLALKEKKYDTSIFSDYTLYDICIKKPHSMEEFREIYGVGDFKADKYGEAFIEPVRRHNFGGNHT